jgi:site-specific recombinase XerD
MSERELLGPWLRRFLVDYIVTERNLARNTRASYRDTFSLLLPFVSGKLRKPVDRIGVRDLSSALVLKFLTHLEDDRVNGGSKPGRRGGAKTSHWAVA